jgi:hypothetical protein
MNVILKIVLSIVAFIIAIPIFAAVQEVAFIKLALIAGLIAGITAIWRYNPDKKDDGNLPGDSQELDKR